MSKEIKEQSPTYGDKKKRVDEFNMEVAKTRVLRARQNEYEIWYRGIGDEILWFYTMKLQTIADPIAFRNSINYFWKVTAHETKLKRTHSSLPGTMVSVLSNVLGLPNIKISEKKNEEGNLKNVESPSETERINRILDESNFSKMFSKHFNPYYLVMGEGVLIPIVDQSVSDVPLVEFYDGRDCTFDWVGNKLRSVIVRRYFSKGALLYVLCDKRSTEKINGKRCATIEYHLYQMSGLGSQEVMNEVKLNTIDELAHLDEKTVFPTISSILASPIFYRFDPVEKRGTSLFVNKIDLFDDLDQSISTRSTTSRRSVPVTYISSKLIEKNDQGDYVAPKAFDKEYVVFEENLNNVGKNEAIIETLQPAVNFEQYNSESLEITMQIIEGIIAQATLGIDLARKDNAQAQREKEKITLITRDSIISDWTSCLQHLCKILLELDDYINNPVANNNEYIVNVDFNEYANPSFDAKLQALQGAYMSGMISPDKLIEETWGKALGDEDRENELEYLKAEREKANMTGGNDPFGGLV